MDIGLLPAQKEMILSTEPYTCFLGGYGSGKTQALVSCAIKDAARNPRGKIGCFSPTYDLLRLTLVPRIEETLTGLGVEFRYNKTESTFYCNGIGDIILRSLDNPARIVGFEVAASHIDELDILTRDKAAEAWKKVLARTRSINSTGINPVFAYTTPEGLRFCYHTWGKNPKKGYKLIRAKTTSNPFLPPDYVQNLRDNYSEKLINAYINGEFCNITGGLVYYNYDSKLNEAKATIRKNTLIRVGMDFNIGKMTAIATVYHQGIIYVFDEITKGYDTRSMRDEILKRWGKSVIIYPDASGQNRGTSSSKTDIALLKEYFRVKAPRQNPLIRDRVNLVNGALCNANGERRLLIDENCVNTIEAIRNQSYKDGKPDKSTGFDHVCDALGYVVWGLLGEKSGISSGVRIY